MTKITNADEAKFWEIIAQTLSSMHDQERQMEALRAQLRKLTLPQIERFAATFDHILRRSYSWDLWGAAFVIMGGASDDSFEYFRVWLISRGRTFFETAENNPDSLADMLPQDFNDVPEFELFAYVGREVWEEKSGRSPKAEFVQPNMIYVGEQPKGRPFTEDQKGLSQRFPKLWARFGQSPLG